MIMLSAADNSWGWKSPTPANNSTPAVKRTNKVEEEEISVEDLPF
jgi:hypothetical protein